MNYHQLLQTLKDRGPTLQVLTLLELMEPSQRQCFCYPEPNTEPRDLGSWAITQSLMERLASGSVEGVAAELELALTGCLDESRLHHPYHRRHLVRVAAYFGHEQAVLAIVEHPEIDQQEAFDLASCANGYTRSSRLRANLVKHIYRRLLPQGGETSAEAQAAFAFLDENAEELYSVATRIAQQNQL